MSRPLRTSVVVFPFDLFGNSGTGAGAELLADVLREVQADTAEESRSTRPAIYAEQLKFREVSFNGPDDVQSWRSMGRVIAKKSLASHDFTLWLGGNHLSVLPLLEELRPQTLVVQFDAHLDVYNTHDCRAELSHGNFLLHVEDPSPRVVNVGHRDLILMPKHIQRTFEQVIPAVELHQNLASVTEQVRRLCESAERIWLDCDVDVIDPTFLPAVLQPVPFGVLPQQLLAVWNAIPWSRVVGVSFSEFCPARDDRDLSLNLLGWLLEWLLLRRTERASPETQ